MHGTSAMTTDSKTDMEKEYGKGGGGGGGWAC